MELASPDFQGGDPHRWLKILLYNAVVWGDKVRKNSVLISYYMHFICKYLMYIKED